MSGWERLRFSFPSSSVLPPEPQTNITSNCREETEWGEPLPRAFLQSASEHDLNPASISDGMGKVRNVWGVRGGIFSGLLAHQDLQLPILARVWRVLTLISPAHTHLTLYHVLDLGTGNTCWARSLHNTPTLVGRVSYPRCPD